MYWLITYVYVGAYGQSHQYYYDWHEGTLIDWVKENYKENYVLVNTIQIPKDEYNRLNKGLFF